MYQYLEEEKNTRWQNGGHCYLAPANTGKTMAVLGLKLSRVIKVDVSGDVCGGGGSIFDPLAAIINRSVKDTVQALLQVMCEYGGVLILDGPSSLSDQDAALLRAMAQRFTSFSSPHCNVIVMVRDRKVWNEFKSLNGGVGKFQ
eukprot:TRINITY_DN13132_c0_g1_i2.p1 TRINITY_DN13132_c0_g1~~TRINITY_DN13132_c0_g1_i2.p1  ORF type:complete len:144 (+),score=5.92 TRINITY_DN13132_c0_g1_i2:505-936(+)